MVKTNYTALAMRPEEIVVCTALDAGNYPAEYLERVNKILENINDGKHREQVRSTLGAFQSGNDRKLAQSSPYRLVVLQEILPEGKVIAFRPKIQTAKEGDDNFMSGFYVDFGLNLVSSPNGYSVNKFVAEALASDLKEVGIDLKDAKLIPYRVLTKEVSKESPSGLVFRLSSQGKDIAKKDILNTGDFKWNYQPSSSGLFRAYLYSFGNWYAGDGGLGDSNDIG